MRNRLASHEIEANLSFLHRNDSSEGIHMDFGLLILPKPSTGQAKVGSGRLPLV